LSQCFFLDPFGLLQTLIMSREGEKKVERKNWRTRANRRFASIEMVKWSGKAERKTCYGALKTGSPKKTAFEEHRTFRMIKNHWTCRLGKTRRINELRRCSGRSNHVWCSLVSSAGPRSSVMMGNALGIFDSIEGGPLTQI